MTGRAGGEHTSQPVPHPSLLSSSSYYLHAMPSPLYPIFSLWLTGARWSPVASYLANFKQAPSRRATFVSVAFSPPYSLCNCTPHAPTIPVFYFPITSPYLLLCGRPSYLIVTFASYLSHLVVATRQDRTSSQPLPLPKHGSAARPSHLTTPSFYQPPPLVIQ